MSLVLALDVSASVDFAEFALMAGGLAAALRDPAVQGAAGGPVALAALFWSEAQEVALPWALLRAPADWAAAADALDAAPRAPRAGATATGEALVAALALLARCPFPAARAVVDVSGDGAANRGRPPGPVRDLGVAAGVVLNALAVGDEEPDLAAHYAREVIGGPGAFVMECASYADFGEAMRRKLLRELGGSIIALR
ncbi:DUF1194 domain-containing protein [Roseococcus sp. DSY-14]|uniref:DUF1194 domain-containing protein n=1 Tax=Roseococcus sp. DSY-14 TaxID=3369650 RepID=UPI00387B90C9